MCQWRGERFNMKWCGILDGKYIKYYLWHLNGDESCLIGVFCLSSAQANTDIKCFCFTSIMFANSINKAFDCIQHCCYQFGLLRGFVLLLCKDPLFLDIRQSPNWHIALFTIVMFINSVPVGNIITHRDHWHHYLLTVAIIALLHYDRWHVLMYHGRILHCCRVRVCHLITITISLLLSQICLHQLKQATLPYLRCSPSACVCVCVCLCWQQSCCVNIVPH